MKIAILGPIATAGIAPLLSTQPPLGFPVGNGGAPIMTTLITELLAKGHEVCAITYGGYEATRTSRPVAARGNRFEFYCCPARKHSIRPSSGHLGRSLDFFAYERRGISEAIAAARPDFIHAHWTYEFAMAAMSTGIPYLITAHDDPTEVLKVYKNAYRLARYLMARRVLRNATAITAVSDDLSRRIAPLARTVIRVVNNPLSYSFIDAGAPRALPPRGQRRALISVINGWSRLKNVCAALLAFSHVRRQLVDATYHLYGLDFQSDGPAERWAIARGVAEGVVFHGPVSQSELVTALDDATLMLHPSRSESCPMGIAEALALGLPVVGGEQSGGVPWMIGEGGLLVDIDNPQAIAQAVLQLLTDDVLYRGCSNAALRRVKAFAPDIIATQYEQLYMRILERARRPQGRLS